MNTKNNKRKRDSKEKIERIFAQLLQTKEINKIAISDICKEARLNRSTFYANYVDIYDLADKLRDNLERQVAELYHDEQVLNFNSNDYLKLFNHMKENQLFYKTYFKLGYEKVEIMKYDAELAERHFDNKFILYHAEFFRNGLNAIVKIWLETGCKETPEEMDEIIRSEYNGRMDKFGNLSSPPNLPR